MLLSMENRQPLSFRFGALRRYTHDRGVGDVVAVFFAVNRPAGANATRLGEADQLVAHCPRRLHAAVSNPVDGRLPGPDGGTDGLLRHSGRDEVLNGC
jgi:hypothetical protein